MRLLNFPPEMLEKDLHKHKEDIMTLARSKYFDQDWYLENNLDIKEKGFNPLLHYLKIGWKEWRDPSTKFNTFLYVDLHGDVISTKLNPLIHYERFGRKEGREVPLPQFVNNDNYTYYLSIVAIVKNEAPYIKEWLDYHINMGVGHFYIYDNESDDNLKEVLAPYIAKEYVTYTFWPGKIQQRPVYNYCLREYGHTTRWLAVIDLDEFICPQEKISLPEFLKEYEAYNALAINWIMFDSNKHLHKPQGSVLRNYVRVHHNIQDSENKHIKSIVNPSKVLKLDCHEHYYDNGEGAVTENFEEVWGPILDTVSVNKIRVNHYFSKSKEEYAHKIARGRADGLLKRQLEEKQYNFPFTTYDCTIWKHIKKKDFKMRLEFLKYEFFRILYKYIKPSKNRSF